MGRVGTRCVGVMSCCVASGLRCLMIDAVQCKLWPTAAATAVGNVAWPLQGPCQTATNLHFISVHSPQPASSHHRRVAVGRPSACQPLMKRWDDTHGGEGSHTIPTVHVCPNHMSYRCCVCTCCEHQVHSMHALHTTWSPSRAVQVRRCPRSA